MGISLTKGGNLSLTKAAPGLTQVSVGLGWDARTTTGEKFDLDASALGLGQDGRILSNEWFVFFNQKRSPGGELEHRGDNRTGDGSGDDEVIAVELSALPADLTSVTFVASVYEAEKHGVSFGQVRNAFIRVVNNSDQSEMARYDLTEDAATETAMVFGELYRSGEEWKFRAIGQGYSTGLAGIAADFGVAL